VIVVVSGSGYEDNVLDANDDVVFPVLIRLLSVDDDEDDAGSDLDDDDIGSNPDDGFDALLSLGT
jgi:hypothetical protein